MTKIESYLAAEKARLNGDLDEALQHYRDALEQDPNDWKMRECVAEVLFAQEDARGSLKELFQAAHRLIWQGAYEDATRLLQKMQRLDPKQEIDISRGVNATLDEIAESLHESAEELPVDGDWGSTKEFLESLVLKESSTDFRVPTNELGEQAGMQSPPRILTLELSGRAPILVSHKEFLIGRAKDCHLILPVGVVSRHHSRIIEIDGHYFLHNWESRNGTLLNGRIVDAEELHHNDVITLGHSGPKADVKISDAK